MSARPTLVRVRATTSPPEMQLAFAGDPGLWISVRIRVPDGASRDTISAAAVAQLAAFNAEACELLRDCARPGPPFPPDPAVLEAAVQPLYRTSTAVGPVYCPRCCAKLGDAESPSLPYLQRCGRCQRPLNVQLLNRGVLVTAEDPE